MKFDEVQVKELISKVDPSALGSEGVDFMFMTRTEADEEYSRLMTEIQNEFGSDEWRSKVSDLDHVVGQRMVYLQNWWCMFALLMGYAQGIEDEYMREFRRSIENDEDGKYGGMDVETATAHMSKRTYNVDLHSLLGAVQYAQKYADGEL